MLPPRFTSLPPSFSERSILWPFTGQSMGFAVTTRPDMALLMCTQTTEPAFLFTASTASRFVGVRAYVALSRPMNGQQITTMSALFFPCASPIFTSCKCAG